MKKFLFCLVLLLPLLTFAQFLVPDRLPQTYVNDYDGDKLTPEQVAALNQKIVTFRAASSIEIVVVVLSDLQGIEIEDASHALFNKWGIGKAGLNNGVLYLVSPNNRKSRIEVGSGLEGDLPDITAKALQEVQKPYYRAGDYYGGITAVLDGITTTLKPITWEQREAYRKKQAADAKLQQEQFIYILTCVGIVALFIGLIFLIYWRRAKAKAAKLAAIQQAQDAAKQKLIREQARQQLYKDVKNDIELVPQKIAQIANRKNNCFRKITDEKLPIDLGTYDAKIKKSEQYVLESLKGKYYAIAENDSADRLQEVNSNLRGLIIQHDKYVGEVERLYGTLSAQVDYVKSFQQRGKALYAAAQRELKNTPHTDLYPRLFEKVMAADRDYGSYFYEAEQLTNHYNTIINYVANQKAAAEKAARDRIDEENRKKRVAEEERKRKTRSQESSNYISYSSTSRSDDSTPSTPSFDLGGGSSGGGGATSDW